MTEKACTLSKKDGSVCGRPIHWVSNADNKGGFYANPDGTKHRCDPAAGRSNSGKKPGGKTTQKEVDILTYDGRQISARFMSDVAGPVEMKINIPEELRASVSAEIGDAAPPYVALLEWTPKSELVTIKRSRLVTPPAAEAPAFKTGSQIAADTKSVTPPKDAPGNPSALWSQWTPGHVQEWGSEHVILTIDGAVDKTPIRCAISPDAMVLGQLRGQDGTKPVPCSFRYRVIDGVPTIMDFKVVPEPEAGPEPGKTYYAGEMLTRAEIEMRKATAPKASAEAEKLAAAAETTVEKVRTSPPAAAAPTTAAQEQPCNNRCMEECDPGKCTAPAPASAPDGNVTANGTGGKVIPCPEIGQATIGVTINLDNYENLRLELTVPVDQLRQAREYLDQELATFGRKDPVTAAKIDRYRQRVLMTGVN